MDDDDFKGNTKEQQELIDKLREVYEDLELYQIKQDLALIKASKAPVDWGRVARRIVSHYSIALKEIFGQAEVDQFRQGLVDGEANVPVGKTVN